MYSTSARVNDILLVESFDSLSDGAYITDARVIIDNQEMRVLLSADAYHERTLISERDYQRLLCHLNCVDYVLANQETRVNMIDTSKHVEHVRLVELIEEELR